VFRHDLGYTFRHDLGYSFMDLDGRIADHGRGAGEGLPSPL